MQVVAHPDDEDGGMLTLESRGKGVQTLLMTLTRGEGGQNKLGSSLFDVLGVLRTLELTASDRYYGVEQRFTRAADFGFSNGRNMFRPYTHYCLLPNAYCLFNEAPRRHSPISSVPSQRCLNRITDRERCQPNLRAARSV